jgi:two-component system response regulator YesN
MYKVLLVDDEKIARDSISNLINWEAHQFVFLGAAKNGFEAHEQIELKHPDIVITDIKMPVMDGLELISKVKAIYPETIFVVLSGYGEYEYTSKAMAYGIKHYLLKPSNEDKIIEVMNSVKEELEKKAREELFIQSLEGKFEKILPLVKDQILRDIVITGVYNKNDCEYFMELFNISKQMFKVVLITFDNPCDYIEKFALKNIAEEIFTEKRVYLSTIIEDSVLLLIKSMDLSDITEYLIKTKQIYENYYKINLFMAVSVEGAVTNIRSMYKEAQDCLRFRYYIEEGGIITIDDIDINRREQILDIPLIFEEIVSATKTGRVSELNRCLEDMFVRFESEKLKINEIKAYCIELFLIILRQSHEDLLSNQIHNVTKIQEFESSIHIFEFLKSIANEIAKENYDNTVKKQNSLIKAVKEIVQKNISNPDLSLKWIANKLLYMNEDYLGKVFSKETNGKFSQYVLNKRMELAKHLIECKSELKVSEISRKTGFSEDAQYFCKVFKKYTQMTPTEYKKTVEENRS